jgi:hypothetical protein
MASLAVVLGKLLSLALRSFTSSGTPLSLEDARRVVQGQVVDYNIVRLRRAEHSPTESAFSPFLAEPTQKSQTTSKSPY